jgi:TlyA family rRNA methyltransferase/putative hemolysin
MAKMGGTTWSMTCVPYAQSWAFCYIHSLLEAGLSMSQKRAKKVRLDSLLVERGLVEDLKSARAWIMSGNVIVDEVREDKPGTSIMPDANIRIRGRDIPFASRGGLKLSAALDAFGVDAQGRIVLDAGASTGGFTDCLLSRGAARVYAVDVGYGQLTGKLRQDPRVVNMENGGGEIFIYLTLPRPGSGSTPISSRNCEAILEAAADFQSSRGSDVGLLFSGPGAEKLAYDVARLASSLYPASAGPDSESDLVTRIGSTVKIRDVELGLDMEYFIVPPEQASATNGLLSSESPVGRAIIGQPSGSTVQVVAPGGPVTYELLEVLNK